MNNRYLNNREQKRIFHNNCHQSKKNATFSLFNCLTLFDYDIINNLFDRLIFDVYDDDEIKIFVINVLIDRVVNIMTIDVMLINNEFLNMLFDDIWMFDEILLINRFDDMITRRLINNLIRRDYFVVEFERECVSSYWLTKFWQSFNACKKYHTLCFDSYFFHLIK